MRPEKRHPNHPGELGTDRSLAERCRDRREIEARARAIEVLQREGVPFLVGGAYAFCNYTGIYRDTKDLDLFARKQDAARALDVLEADGWEVERTDEVWLYKAFSGDYFVDFIFCSGNGVATVDDEWFASAPHGDVFGKKVLLTPAEEMIWSKAFVAERERFDGADVAHVIRAIGDTLDWHRLLRRFDRHWEVLLTPAEEMIWSKAFVAERERFDGADVAHVIRAIGDTLDWHRLLRRFDRHWEVLLGHLMFYRFIYPSDRANVPDWLMVELLSRTMESVREGDWEERICRGPLMSRVNYGVDMSAWGYRDGRKWDEHERLKEELRRGLGSAIEDSSGSGG